MATAMTPTEKNVKKKNEQNNERNEDTNAARNDLLGTVKHTHKIVQE